jgi:hypothetical protein
VWLSTLANQTLIFSPVVVALVVCCAYLWRGNRHLLAELAKANARADEWGSLLALEHATNYELACQLHGKAAVDHAMRVASTKGLN